MKFNYGVILVAVFALMAIPVPVLAATQNNDEIVVGGEFVLEEGQELDGNLVVLAGGAQIQAGSRVIGNVTILAGEVTLRGEVNGDIILVGGLLTIDENALVKGVLNVVGGDYDIASGVVIEGSVQQSLKTIRSSTIQKRESLLKRWLHGFWGWYWVLLVSAMAIVFNLIWPKNLQRISLLLHQNPPLAGGIGLVTTLILFPVVLLALITIVFSPLGIFLMLVWLFAILFGWASLSEIVGEKIAGFLGQAWAPGLVNGIGSFGLAFLFVLLGSLPFLGWLMEMAVIMICLGAAVLTRFGTRIYLSLDPG